MAAARVFDPRNWAGDGALNRAMCCCCTPTESRRRWTGSRINLGKSAWPKHCASRLISHGLRKNRGASTPSRRARRSMTRSPWSSSAGRADTRRVGSSELQRDRSLIIARRDEVGAAERGQEVVQRDLIRQVLTREGSFSLNRSRYRKLSVPRPDQTGCAERRAEGCDPGWPCLPAVSPAGSRRNWATRRR